MAYDAERQPMEPEHSEVTGVSDVVKKGAEIGASKSTGLKPGELPTAIEQDKKLVSAGVAEQLSIINGSAEDETRAEFDDNSFREFLVSNESHGSSIARSGFGVSAEIPTEKGPIKLHVEYKIGGGGYLSILNELIQLAKEQGVEADPDKIKYTLDEEPTAPSPQESEEDIDVAA